MSERLSHRRLRFEYSLTKFSYTFCFYVFITHKTNEVVFKCRYVLFWYNFHFVISSFLSNLICKSWEVFKTVKKVVQNKNASFWNWTPNIRLTAHRLNHRANGDLPQSYTLIFHKAIRYSISDLLKSQFDSLISIYKLGCLWNMHECHFKPK